MNGLRRYVGMFSLLLAFAGASSTAYAESLRIGVPVWVGFGPLYIADEKGFFADEGVDVHLIKFDEGAAEALFNEQIDALVQDFSTTVVEQPADERVMHYVFAIDDSAGGDGIVATQDIQSIADLKGKAVAFDDDTVSEFYLNVLLSEVGLSAADIEIVSLDAQDAAEAFMLQEVDAVVTWEPSLTAAKNTEHGHLLADSSSHPGLIVDGLLALPNVFETRREEFKAVARAWDRAVDFVEAHQGEAIEIMARNVGGWLEDPAEFAAAMEGVRFYGKTRNQEYFGTAESPGEIYKTMQHAIDIWSELGQLQKSDLVPTDLIAHGIWD
ncbi:MAG: ABC transporter substrate-binding protein [Geminicoccaceae bacterium]